MVALGCRIWGCIPELLRLLSFIRKRAILRRLLPKVLNIRVRALKPLVFLVNILNILNINALYSSDINAIYPECMYMKYIVAILLYAYGVCSCDITVCIVAIAAQCCVYLR